MAGTGTAGYVADGVVATTAPLNNPTDVAVDMVGNIYIADQGNHRIRKVYAASGLITTVAGTGVFGNTGDGGNGVLATLNSPSSIVLDQFGNIYIADTNNNVIRKVDASGAISTILGLSLSSPKAIVVDNSNNLLVVNSSGVIQKVAINGSVTSVTSLSVGITISDLAIDSWGNLLAADSSTHQIKKIALDGTISTLVGTGVSGFSGDGGIASLAQLNAPTSISVDRYGNIFVVDRGNNRIRKIIHGYTPALYQPANITLSAIDSYGLPATDAAITAFLSSATAMDTEDGVIPAINISNDAPSQFPIGVTAVRFSVTDSDGMRSTAIAKVTITQIKALDLLTLDAYGATSAALTVSGGSGSYVYTSLDTHVATVDNSGVVKMTGLGTTQIIINDSASGLSYISTVKVIDSIHSTTTSIINNMAGTGTAGFSGDGGAGTAAQFDSPYRISVDRMGNVYVADRFNHRIRKIDAMTGIVSTVAGTGVAGFSGDGGPAIAAQLNYPSGVDIDSSGNIYIADRNNNRIRKIDSITGIITTVVGTGVTGYSGDGLIAISATISYPDDIAINDADNIYIADVGNNRIRKLDVVTGIISTVASLNNASYGIDIDRSGNIYLAEQSNSMVRKIDAVSGNISTVAGTGTMSFSGDGAAAIFATLWGPMGVNVDAIGNLYIADTRNNSIRKVDAVTGNITTVAGRGVRFVGWAGDGGLATAAWLHFPNDVNVDGMGNLYIADTGNNRIRKVTQNHSPVVYPAANITIAVSILATGIAKTNATITAFLAATTARDTEDGAIPASNIRNDAPTVFPIGVTTVKFSVTDSDGAVGMASATITVSIDSDGDGVVDFQDAFPNDPAASIDTDKDGFPDSWNGNATSAQVAASILKPDAYPTDKTKGLDVTAPVITMLGTNPMTITKGAPFVDPMVVVNDDVDGSISTFISGNVDTTVSGTYIISYTATDSAGNTTSSTRTVVVNPVVTMKWSLNKGWNLVAIPINLGSDSINTLAALIHNQKGDLQSVWSLVNSQWQSWNARNPMVSTLNGLDTYSGYWLNLSLRTTGPIQLSIRGTVVTPPFIMLNNGWNLVGTDQQRAGVGPYLAGILGFSIWSYTNGTWDSFLAGSPVFLNSLQTIQPGRGYYILKP